MNYSPRLSFLLICFIVLFNRYAPSIYAQSWSLSEQLDTAKSALARYSVYERFINQYKQEGAFSASIQTARSYYNLCVQQQDTLHLILASNKLLQLFYRTMEYDSCLFYAFREQELFLAAPQWNNPERAAKNYNNIGIFYTQLYKYRESIKWLLQSKAIREKTQDPLMRSTLTNLGLAYYNMGAYEKAIEYNQAAIALKIKQQKTPSLLSNYNNMGLIYEQLFKLDSAIYFVEKAISICKETGQERKIKSFYLNLANIYDKKQAYMMALNYATEALDNRQPLQRSNIKVLYKIAKLNLLLKRPTEAKDALDNMQFIGMDSSMLAPYYRLHKDYHLQIGKEDSAAAYFQKSRAIEQVLEDKKLKKYVLDLEKKYETERKEEKIAYLDLENQVKNRQLTTMKVAGAFLFVLLVMLCGFVWYIRQQNRLLNQLNTTKDKLFAVVAHDIKNPLMAFRSITQSLQQNLHQMDLEEIQYYIDKLALSSNNLYQLNQNLLQWALSQNNKIQYSPYDFELSPVTNEMIEIFDLNALRNNIKIHNNIAPNKYIQTDLKFYQTILRNLLDNAIKFSPDGGSIHINSDKKDDFTTISVADEGLGMSPVVAQQLFNEHAKSTNEHRQLKGTGVGLMLVKELVHRQGGKIWVESMPDKGSTFYFTVKNGVPIAV